MRGLILRHRTELNQIICDRIDELRATQDMHAIMKLQLGAKVHFQSKERQVFGTLIKINRKSVIIVAEDGRQWKIPPGLVNMVNEIIP